MRQFLVFALLLCPLKAEAVLPQANVIQWTSPVSSITLPNSVPVGSLLVFVCKSESAISGLTLTDSGTGASFTQGILDSGHSNNQAVYWGITTILGTPNVAVVGCPYNYSMASLASFGTNGTVSAEVINSCYNGASPSSCSVTTTASNMVFSSQAGYHNDDLFSPQDATIMLGQKNGNDALAVGFQIASPGVNTASYDIEPASGTDNAPLEVIAFTHISAGRSTTVSYNIAGGGADNAPLSVATFTNSSVSQTQGNIIAWTTGTTSVSLSNSVVIGSLLVFVCQSQSAIGALTLTDSGTGATFSLAISGASGNKPYNNQALYWGTTTAAGTPNVSVSGCPYNFSMVALASFSTSGSAAYESSNWCYNGATPSVCSITAMSASLIFSAQGGYHDANTFTANAPTTLLTQNHAAGSAALAIGYAASNVGLKVRHSVEQQ